MQNDQYWQYDKHKRTGDDICNRKYVKEKRRRESGAGASNEKTPGREKHELEKGSGLLIRWKNREP